MGGRKNGRIKRGQYWYLYIPTHPLAGKQGYYAEHRLVMEAKIGRYLTKKEVIHHINHDAGDNRVENLELCESAGIHSAKYHPEVLSKLLKASVGRIPWNKGKKNVYSDEVLKKMSLALKGRKIWNKGKPWSEAVKKKLSITGKGRHYSAKSEFKKGMIPWNKGKHASAETIVNLRLARIKYLQNKKLCIN